MKVKRFLMIVACCFLLSGCQQTAIQEEIVLPLKSDEFLVELGTAISLNASSYLDLDELSEDIKQNVEQNAILSVEEMLDDRIEKDGQSYEKVGNYKGILSYGDTSQEIQIRVEDTIAPVIEGPDSIILNYGQTYDYSTDYIVKDYDEAYLEFDDSKVDLQTPGQYVLNIKATDMSGNVSTKEIQVTVEGSLEEENTNESVENTTASNNWQALYEALKIENSFNLDYETFEREAPEVLDISHIVEYGKRYANVEVIETKTMDVILPLLQEDTQVLIYLNGNTMVLMTGYDEENQMLTIFDPTNQQTTLSFDQFEQNVVGVISVTAKGE